MFLNYDEFNNLVEEFTATREQLKTKLVVEQGKSIAEKQQIEAQTKPVVEAIEGLRAELKTKPTMYSVFERYVNSTSKGSSEVRYTRRGNDIIYKKFITATG